MSIPRFTPSLREAMDQRNKPSLRFDKVVLASVSNLYSTTGFTLIEVVIALAILGMALTMILGLFSGGLRLGRISGEYVKAMNYASSKMEEVSAKLDFQEGTEEGEFDQDYRWQTNVKKLDLLPIKEKGIDFKPPVELLQIKVNVLWKSGAKERSAAIESYRTVEPKSDEKKK